jgi:Uma2 family endonuclease
MPLSEPLVTAEEFARIPDDGFHYELILGRVVRMNPPGGRHGALSTRLAILIGQHVEAHNLGVLLTPAGFKIAANPDTVREPDLAFVAIERIPGAGIPDGFWPGPPDLAVEITSPGDRQREIREKVRDYLERGVRLVWVVDPRTRTVTVHRPHLTPETLGVDDTLDGEDVVIGFSCGVSRIFA